ncbi:hypothetical protein BGW36DRAFT_397328 [Talaromyces proteolyticus]|uniref:Uncharacterized protein n=1 Tax=Talaromyces proteolyticus TaxID=1131652 RepID=A0AAD4Q0X4_9EURO|nr:uncharacterized protein BGW36DRAFT_397328 [Talaromyces proteolyticus]KAH8697668.1 hypothetical protein BGW36DRAFT_397328 [Talaromyces proteolyticus]
MIAQRTTSLLAIVAIVGFVLFIFSRSSGTISESVPSVKFGPSRYIPTSFDDFRHPFRPAAHKPPEQQHSTSGESKWYSDWKWMNPFSSSITLDEHRTVLPPLPERPPVYTFYEPNKKDDDAEKNADSELLLAWRRAWYAKGFRPVVLSQAEALNNQLYEDFQLRRQQLNLGPELELDFVKWLAWGNMGTGLFADWRCFPMAGYDDDIFTYLRAGALPTHITRFEDLDRALFAGEKNVINDAIKAATEAADKIQDTLPTSIIKLIPAEMFKMEHSDALAYYHDSTITSSYPKLAEKHVSSTVNGRLALAELINAHLHTTFLNIFPSGIAVLKPLPEHTSALIEPAMHLAKSLIKCPRSESPSCPPNRPTCQLCDPQSKPLPISQPQSFKNTTTAYTIGTLPHPYTLISLQHTSGDIDVKYIRRETSRNPWLTEVTKELLGPDHGESSRAVAFKETVAGDDFVWRTFWMTVETFPAQPGQEPPSTVLDELEWLFGFKIPRDEPKNTEDSKKTPEKAQDGEDKKPETKPNAILEQEYELISKARELLRDKQTNRISIRNVAEAWNLADVEVWRFVQAYRARSAVEREQWEEEEKQFVGVRVN